jgi:hypothetical protein
MASQHPMSQRQHERMCRLQLGDHTTLYDMRTMQTVVSSLSLSGYEVVQAGNSLAASDSRKAIPSSPSNGYGEAVTSTLLLGPQGAPSQPFEMGGVTPSMMDEITVQLRNQCTMSSSIPVTFKSSPLMRETPPPMCNES